MALWHAAVLLAGTALAEGLTRRPRPPTYQTPAFRGPRFQGGSVATDIVVGEIRGGRL